MDKADLNDAPTGALSQLYERFERASRAQAWGDYGRALVDVGKYEPAAEAFEAAIREAPLDSPVSHWLTDQGNALLQLGRVERARVSFSQALAQADFDEDSDAYFSLKLAEKLQEGQIPEKPSPRPIAESDWAGLGSAFGEVHVDSEAIERFAQLLPDEARSAAKAWYSLGQKYEHGWAGHSLRQTYANRDLTLSLAIAAFERGLVLDSQDKDQIKAIARCYSANHEHEKAAACGKRLFELKLQHPEWGAYGTALSGVSRYDLAVDAFERALSAAPEHERFDLLVALGDSLLEQGHVARACEAYSEASEFEDFDDELTLTDIRFQRAERCQEGVMPENLWPRPPVDVLSWQLLGCAFGEVYADAQAIERFAQLLPDDASLASQAWYSLGETYASGNLGLAIVALERAVALAPEDPDLLEQLSNYCVANHENEKATIWDRQLLEVIRKRRERSRNATTPEAMLDHSKIARYVLAGDVISAEVVSIDVKHVVVNAGLESESHLPIEEFKNDRGELEVTVGDFVEVAVVAAEHANCGDIILRRGKSRNYDDIILTRHKAQRLASPAGGALDGGI